MPLDRSGSARRRSIPLLVLLAGACREPEQQQSQSGRFGFDTEATVQARAQMVEHLRLGHGFEDERVLAAMGAVPRHCFVPAEQLGLAYRDRALPIEHHQTISQPYVVAVMTAAADVDADDTVLEIGTGSGYQAAVLAELAHSVHTVEIVPELVRQAAARLARLGCRNVHSRTGDGYRGWPAHAPFDAILVTAAPDHVPEPLRQQLKVGGRLVIPVGSLTQDLLVMTRTLDGFETRTLMDVRFVPMTGEAEHAPR